MYANQGTQLQFFLHYSFLRLKKVYKCVESDQIVSPLVFHKDFQPPLETVRPEYQLLEEFLDNGNPIPNPYEEFLMNQIEVQEEKPNKVDPYFPNSKEINNS